MLIIRQEIKSDYEKVYSLVTDAFCNAKGLVKGDECERVKGQLSYIVQDIKEERQQGRNRGYHM